MTLPVVQRKPLVILVADLDIENAVSGLLSRFRSLGIWELKPNRDFMVLRHRNRDAGCRSAGAEFLSSFSDRYEHALIVFDHDGCGAEEHPREEIEKDLEDDLATFGWGSRGAAVCIDPELEAWVWSLSPKVPEVLGWTNRKESLRDWLVGQGQIKAGAVKPGKPKEALESVLRELHRSRSASIYGELAKKVGLNRCEDAAFSKLKTVLRRWFAADASADSEKAIF